MIRLAPSPRSHKARPVPVLVGSALQGLGAGPGAIVGAGALQISGLALFFIGLWPRIRSSGANPEGR